MNRTVSIIASEGTGSPRSRRRRRMNSEMSRPPSGSVFTAVPNTYPSDYIAENEKHYHGDDRGTALARVHHHARHR